MSIKDCKNRNIKIGDRVRIEKDIPSPDGMLYKNSLVKISEFNEGTSKIRVTDSLGKVWWINPTAVSCSFL